MIMNRRYLFGTTILAGILASTAVMAQSQTSTSTPQDEEAATVSEVVVTG